MIKYIILLISLIFPSTSWCFGNFNVGMLGGFHQGGDPPVGGPFSLSDPDLKALWYFDGNISDEMGLNNLNVTGALTYNDTVKVQGTYSSYASSSGKYYYIDDVNLNGIDFSGDFSAGTFFHSTSDSSDQKIFGKFKAIDGSREFEIFRESSDDSIGITVSGDGTSTQRADLNAGANTWPINTFLSLIVTHDAASHILRLYKDGVEVTTGNLPYTLPWVPYVDGNSPLYIHGNGADSTRPGVGYQDETFFIGRVITPTEVSNIYTYGFGAGR
jgi:hypothetical protein